MDFIKNEVNKVFYSFIKIHLWTKESNLYIYKDFFFTQGQYFDLIVFPRKVPLKIS